MLFGNVLKVSNSSSFSVSRRIGMFGFLGEFLHDFEVEAVTEIAIWKPDPQIGLGR